MSTQVECCCSWCDGCGYVLRGDRTAPCRVCEGTGVEYLDVEDGEEVFAPFVSATSSGREAIVALFVAAGLTAWDTPMLYGQPPFVSWLPEGPSAVETEDHQAAAAA